MRHVSKAIGLTLALFTGACSDSSPLAPGGRHGLTPGRASAVTIPSGGLTLHGGGPWQAAKTYAIFYGSNWNVPSFVGDKVTAITSFLQGFGGSKWASELGEYWNGLPGISSSTFATTLFNYGAGPVYSSDQANLLAGLVCGVLTANGIAPEADAFYVLYTDQSPPSGDTYGVGWHNLGDSDCGSLHVAIVFNYNDDAATDGATGWSNRAEALVTTTAHELAETITDPDGSSGWRVSGGGDGEIGDKCYWQIDFEIDTLANGAAFYMQDLWSNLADDFGEGKVNGNNEPGCVKSLYVPPGVTSVVTNPSPATRYQPFSLTVLGKGFDTASAQIVYSFYAPGTCPPNTQCSATITPSVRTPTQLVVPSITFGDQSGTLYVQVTTGSFTNKSGLAYPGPIGVPIQPWP